MTARSTERLICLLESVNAEAVNNDGGKPGEFLAAVCREAAARLREMETANKERLEHIGEMLTRGGYSTDDLIHEIADHHDGDHGC